MVEGLDPMEFRSVVGMLKEGWLSHSLAVKGFESLIVPLRSPIDLGFLWDLVSIVKSRKINLIHSHEFTMNFYGSLVSVVTGVPIIATVHGKNYYGEKRRRRLSYRFVSKTARMVAVSNDIAKFLVEEIGIFRDNITTIHNGIRTDLYYKDNDARRQQRSELGLSDNEFLIGTVGSLYPVKGHTYLLKAIAIIKKSIPNVKAIIVGKGYLLGKLKEEASSLNLNSDIQFLGFREDIPKLIQSMDVFVLSSLSEGHPLSLLEAMASQIPVVVTDVGGLKEVVEDGRNGCIVSPNNPQALADKIIMLLIDKILADKLAIAGQMKVYKEFNVKNMLKDYTHIYNM